MEKKISSRKKQVPTENEWLAFYDGRDKVLRHLIILVQGILKANNEQRDQVIKQMRAKR